MTTQQATRYHRELLSFAVSCGELTPKRDYNKLFEFFVAMDKVFTINDCIFTVSIG